VLCDCRPSLLCADALVGACPAVGLSVRVSVVLWSRVWVASLSPNTVVIHGNKRRKREIREFPLGGGSWLGHTLSSRKGCLPG
jgi:hypothetical protein